MLIISTVLGAAALMILLINYSLRILVVGSVPGSHRKYVLTTTLLLYLVIESLAWAIVAVVDLYLERYFSASIEIILSVWALWIIRSYAKDDNWFNSTGKRLKKRLRSLASFRIRIRMPRVALSPSA